MIKVQIWSDVMCPFCYIGKRKIEAAIRDLPAATKVEIEWKSYQLNPQLVTQPQKRIHEYLAEVKGWSVAQAQQMNEHVSQLAASEGLTYNLDQAVVANSMDAHRLSHLAKKHGCQNQLEELLFQAYFTNGKNTADQQTLTEIGIQAGIPEIAIKQLWLNEDYKQEVENDQYEAYQIGVKGVPFFVFDSQFAVSGAQPVSVFQQAFAACLTNTATAEPTSESVCTPDGCN